MKTKKISKKLGLNKVTISNVDAMEMGKMFNGRGFGCPGSGGYSVCRN